jgi:membrane protein
MSVLKLSSALAYYTVFSLPGLLIIIIWVSDLFYGRDVVEGTVYHQLEGFLGHSVAVDIQETIRDATTGSGNNIATIIGLIALVIGATTVFGEIQDSINRIWHLKAKPRKGFAILKMVFNRLISLSMIVSLGFILLVSLLINGALDFLLDKLMARYPDLTVVLVYIINITLTFLITSCIFAAIFKVLPDARIKWRHVWAGAFVTAALFMVGRFLITYYLGHNKITTAYGAAGSIIVVLLWVYYSAMILYFGAAYTHAYVMYKGSRIYPNSYAVWVQQIEVESDTSIQQQPVSKTVIETKPPPGQ